MLVVLSVLRAYVVDESSLAGPDFPDSIDRVELRGDVVRALCGDDGWALLAGDTEELRITMTTFLTLSPTCPAAPSTGLRDMFAPPPAGWRPASQPTVHAGFPLPRDVIEGVRRDDPENDLVRLNHSDTPTCRLLLISDPETGGAGIGLEPIAEILAGGELTLDFNALVVAVNQDELSDEGAAGLTLGDVSIPGEGEAHARCLFLHSFNTPGPRAGAHRALLPRKGVQSLGK